MSPALSWLYMLVICAVAWIAVTKFVDLLVWIDQWWRHHLNKEDIDACLPDDLSDHVRTPHGSPRRDGGPR